MIRNATRPWRGLAVILLAAGLTGCASMSEQECLTADWHDQGMREALAGKPRTALNDDREACAKVGVVPDEARYMAGYAVGIRQFCTPENGAQWGLAGRSYQNSCPADLQQGFVNQYRDGRKVYDSRQSIDRLNNQMRTKEQELDKAKDDKTRSRLRNDLRDLDRQMRTARDDLYYAERRMRR